MASGRIRLGARLGIPEAERVGRSDYKVLYHGLAYDGGLAFLSPAAFWPQPSPKHLRGGFMTAFDRPDQPGTSSIPAACPACSSTSVTTTAKHPDGESYWRCQKCGEV